jgi:hypothetical protein
LEIRINCHKLTSQFTKKITVTTNDPKHAVEHLICMGTILEAVRITPKNLNFGRISRRSEVQTKKVVLTRGDGGPIKLKLLGDAPSSIEVKLTEIEPGERYELEATVRPTFASERVSANLRLETGVADAPAASVRVFATVTPRISLQPRRVSIAADRDPAWKQTFRLMWDDDAPAKVLEVKIDNPYLTLTVQEVDGRQQFLLGALPDYTVRTRKHTVTVVTDDPEIPEVKISLTITGKIKSSRASRKVSIPSRDRKRKIAKMKANAAVAKAAKGATAKPQATAPE